MTCRAIDVPADADVRRVGVTAAVVVDGMSIGVSLVSESDGSVSIIDDESAIDSIMEEVAAVAAMAGAAAAGVIGVGAGIGFGLSSSDASNLSLGPSDATTRNP